MTRKPRTARFTGQESLDDLWAWDVAPAPTVDRYTELARAHDARVSRRLEPPLPSSPSPDGEPVEPPPHPPKPEPRPSVANGPSIYVVPPEPDFRADVRIHDVFGRYAPSMPPFDVNVVTAMRCPAAWRRINVIERLDVAEILRRSPEGLVFTTGADRERARRQPKMHRADWLVLECLDRAPYAVGDILHRYANPSVKYESFQHRTLRKLVAHGLVARAAVPIREHFNEGAVPHLYRLTVKGWRVLRREGRSGRKTYDPPKRLEEGPLRKIVHDLRCLSWVVLALDHIDGAVDWCTPSWSRAHIDVPWVADATTRKGMRPLRLDDFLRRLPFSVAVSTEPSSFKPDAIITIERTHPGTGEPVRFPAFVEYDRKRESADLNDKLKVFESFKVWSLSQPALRALNYDRAICLFVTATPRGQLTLLRTIDLGVQRDHALEPKPSEGPLSGFLNMTHRYWPARECVFSVREADLYAGVTQAFAPEPEALWAREDRGIGGGFRFHRVDLGARPYGPDHSAGRSQPITTPHDSGDDE